MNAHKRKLSASAVEPEDRKKSRQAEDDGDEDEGVEEGECGDSEEGSDADSEEASDRGEENEWEQRAPKLEAPGPHVFYIWADAILSVIDEEDCEAHVTLKPSVLEAYRPAADLPKDTISDVLWKKQDEIKSWIVSASDKARAAPMAKALLKKWWDGERKAKEAKKEAGDVEHKDVQWWYEVTLCKEQPEKDVPHIKVHVEDNGHWHMTEIVPADKEGEDAMEIVADITATRYY